jgi:hypothetical protein
MQIFATYARALSMLATEKLLTMTLARLPQLDPDFAHFTPRSGFQPLDLSIARAWIFLKTARSADFATCLRPPFFQH